ncbi:MAG TPA: DUF3638 and DUF3645 domain-containing protein, partial [Chlamydiales bacterium]|nr:DUF3638 and DUF3645 domain-containing protein [Chlamydiales bacterium]
MLANGQRLLRVIVPKPLAGAMFNLLKQRISRLANRRIFFLPFRRDLHLSADGVHQISAALQHCMKDGGLVLCQPEHILSFKLMGYYKLCTDTSEAKHWIKMQNWLDMFTRDILDESDELLSVKYQLTYTVGAQIPLSSDRWSLIQQVLTLVKQHSVTLAEKLPGGVAIGRSTATSFPSTRILTKKYAIALTKKLARSIIYEEKVDQVSLRTYSNKIRRQAYEFILTDSDSEISGASYEILKATFGESFEQLLLVRGLLGLGIMKFCLMEKRWSVDYGLHPERTRLAVPYRAKDSPALRAEFAHPDIIIILTCLSYYYGGLTNEQLESTFKSLMDCDNPEARYAEWTKGDDSGLPNNLNAINLDDPSQKHNKVFPSLRFNKAVIDFYLSQSVFPKEAKQFEHKLTANAWDLAPTKKELVTGFSGTNDNRYLLPLSISQDDSVGQGHTNAEVLGYLLRHKNRTVILTGANPSAEDLIIRASRQ